jgi:hypothetical protein
MSTYTNDELEKLYFKIAESELAPFPGEFDKFKDDPMVMLYLTGSPQYGLAHEVGIAGAVLRRSVHAWAKTQAQEVVAPNPAKRSSRHKPNRAKRPDRLHTAIVAGLKACRNRYGTDPTADALFDWLAEHDDTGTIVDSDDSHLWWKMWDGNSKKVSRKSIANRLPRIKRESPA